MLIKYNIYLQFGTRRDLLYKKKHNYINKVSYEKETTL